MKVDHEQLAENIIKITLDGRMDIPGSNATELKISGIMARNNTRYIIDMSKVSFLCSMGIRVFVLNAKAVRRRGGSMVIANPQDIVHTVIDMAGLEGIIPIYSSIEEALAGKAG